MHSPRWKPEEYLLSGVKQKARRQAPEKQEFIISEVETEARRSEVHLAMVAEENRHKLVMMSEDNRVMMADLSSMTEDQKAWMIKRQKAIRERDV